MATRTASDFAPAIEELEAVASGKFVRSDLLPPRHEDNVVGEVGARFLGPLKDELARGTYQPTAAIVVPAPKPGFTSRPACVLRLQDRIVYAALVEKIRKRIQPRAVDGKHVLWPTPKDGAKQWKAFINAPQIDGSSYIVEADLAAYYSSLEHGELARIVSRLTGRSGLAAFLERFLGQVMGRPRGIPQGLDASDLLATLYLDRLDGELAAHAIHYWRHGDDIRIAAGSWAQARALLHALEEHAWKLGLTLNGTKTQIVRRETYETRLRSLKERETRMMEQAADNLRERLESSDDEVKEILEQLERSDLWDLFYEEDTIEVIEIMTEEVDPNDEDVGRAFFDTAFEDRPGQQTKSPLPDEEFHFFLVEAIRRLGAARSAYGVNEFARMLTEFPDKTALLSQHLIRASKVNPRAVAKAVAEVLDAGDFLSPHQRGWVLAVAEAAAAHLDKEALDAARHLGSSLGDPFVKAHMARALGRAGALSRPEVVALWREFPVQFRPDLIYGAASSPQADHRDAAELIATGDPVLVALARRASDSAK